MSTKAIIAAAAAALCVIPVTACAAGSDEAQAPQSSVLTTTDAQKLTPTLQPSVTSDVEPSPNGEPVPNGGVTTGDDISTGNAPDTVPESRSGTPLGLEDAHPGSIEGFDWEEGLYEVADRSNVRGMGVTVAACGSDSTFVPTLEYRLANRFSTLNLLVGQDNDSRDSDQVLTVSIEGNGRQLEIRQFPFNRLESIEDIDITGVNALRIRLFLAEDSCAAAGGSGKVTAVIENLIAT